MCEDEVLSRADLPNLLSRSRAELLLVSIRSRDGLPREGTSRGVEGVELRKSSR